MKRTFLAFAVAAASAAPGAFAENQIWTAYELTGKAPAGLPLELSLNGEVRFEPDAEITQFVLRPGIGYALNDRLHVSGGYRYGQALRDGPDQIEHRLWQQANYDIVAVGDAEISGRTRLEQRFREGESGTGWRIRQQVSLEYPLAKSGVRLALSDEIIIGLKEADWGNADGFQENRARATFKWTAAGIGWEAGYLNQFRNGQAGAADEANDHIFLGVSKEF
jgi:Protein of unknown function (DUF2490)